MMDEILREARRVREELAARFGYDVAALREYLKESQARRGTATVDLSQQRKAIGSVAVADATAPRVS